MYARTSHVEMHLGANVSQLVYDFAIFFCSLAAPVIAYGYETLSVQHSSTSKFAHLVLASKKNKPWLGPP